MLNIKATYSYFPRYYETHRPWKEGATGEDACGYT